MEYEAVDSDGDGYIDYIEYNDILKDSDFFTQWDINSTRFIEENELAEGVFKARDSNGSGYLEREEFEEFDSYYLDI